MERGCEETDGNMFTQKLILDLNKYIIGVGGITQMLPILILRRSESIYYQTIINYISVLD